MNKNRKIKKDSKKRLYERCKSYIEESFDYIKKSKNYIYFSIGVFLFFCFIGFFFAENFTFLDTYLKEILSKSQNLDGISLILYIFKNNVGVSFLSIILGIFLGIFPLFNSLSNGLVLGYVFAKVYSISGVSEFWRILPHGIFELPAIFISLGLGVRMGVFVFSKNLSLVFVLITRQ